MKLRFHKAFHKLKFQRVTSKTMAEVCDFRNMTEFLHAFAHANARLSNGDWGVVAPTPEKEETRQRQNATSSYQPKALLHFLDGEMASIISTLDPDPVPETGLKRSKSAEFSGMGPLELF